MIVDPFADYPPSILARFKAWHHQNPKVYSEFKTLSFQMLATGRERYSAYSIFQVIVWHVNIQTVGDNFKVNHDFIPIYVRMLIHEHPEFEGFFELRVVRSKGQISDEQWVRQHEEEEYSEWWS